MIASNTAPSHAATQILRAPRTQTGGRAPLLSADEETQLARKLQRARRELLLLTLSSPTALATLREMQRAVQAGGLSVWEVIRRRGGEAGKALSEEAAKQQLREGCERLERLVSSHRTGAKGVLRAHSGQPRPAQRTPHAAPLQGLDAALVKLQLTESAKARLLAEVEGKLPARLERQRRGAQRVVYRVREAFVAANQGLVHNLARGYSQQGLSFADLVQEGNLGLMRAVEKFDPALGYRFSTYAVWWIRHALRRALSNQSRTIRLPVHATENRASLRHARLRLERNLGHPPSDEELAAAAGLSTSKLRDLLAVAGAPLSLDGGSDSPGKLSLAECLGDPNAKDPCDTIAQRSAQQWLEQRLAELAPREQEMLKLRFGLGGGEALTLKEVGHEFGVTRERVRQIVSAAIDRLRSAADSDADRIDRPVGESSN